MNLASHNTYVVLKTILKGRFFWETFLGNYLPDYGNFKVLIVANLRNDKFENYVTKMKTM